MPTHRAQRLRKRLALALVVLVTGCGRTITAPCWQSVQADTLTASGYVIAVSVRVPCDGR